MKVSLPLREELEALSHAYRHLHNEIQGTKPGSSVRRKLEVRLGEVGERFERLLDEWVDDEELRDRWREHLHARGPEPDGPSRIAPLVFRGENDAGSVAEVRRRNGELDLYVDGGLLERMDAPELGSPRPGLVLGVDGFAFRETFAVSPEARDALADFVANDEQPPWEHASELLAEGLIDVHFDLTPRGRRALAA
ncbi:MAG: hypothetical protein ACXVRJ_12070 [Gaiellaceae bacterium]